jgi:CDP-2,3-bis-(O-geranylgeranyl)-sn-glycerol synthase
MTASNILAQAAYLCLPLIGGAACAGWVMAGQRWLWLKRPIDGGATFHGRRLFGDNKTWRGLACSWVGSVATVALQKYVLNGHAGSVAVLDYRADGALGLGTAFAVGAIIGELPNSFLKRQSGIDPGGRPRGARVPVFYVLDQVDVLLGVWPLLLLWLTPSASLVAASFAVVFVVHQIVSVLGVAVGARRSAFW